MATNRVAIRVLAAVAWLVACTNDGTSPEPDTLTREEALTFTEQIMESSAEAFYGTWLETSYSVSPATASSGELHIITAEQTANHPCPVSGRLAFELKMTLEIERGDRFDYFSYAVDGTLTPEVCAFNEGDGTLTVDDSSLDFATHHNVVGSEYKPVTTETGGQLRWSASDGRSGKCTISLLDEFDTGEPRRLVQGELCGHTIARVVT